MAILSLDDIVKVVVDISPRAAVRPSFNIGLIVGKSTVISVEDRIREYTSLTAMLEDGFATSSFEYQAASLYFGQRPAPSSVCIGRWDGSEDVIAAMTDCRMKNLDWYTFTFDIDWDTTDMCETLAEWTESTKPWTAFFYTAPETEIFGILKQKDYFASHGLYHEEPTAAASIMGYALGANTQLNNSAYTLAYKSLPGVMPSDLSENDINLIKNNNGNIYVSRGRDYLLYEQGVQANGASFDELINLDQLANNVQMSVLDLLKGRSKVPQTEDGVSSIIAAITPDLEKAVNIGFIAPGLWNGPNVLNLSTGDALPRGYAILSESIASQSQADRDARKAPNIYCPIKLAGAIEHVVLQIPVNR